MSPEVVVYTREGCGLCRTAEALVAEVAAGRADVRHVDVDSEPELTRRYGVRVPVVAVDGVEVGELVIERGELLRALGP